MPCPGLSRLGECLVQGFQVRGMSSLGFPIQVRGMPSLGFPN